MTPLVSLGAEQCMQQNSPSVMDFKNSRELLNRTIHLGNNRVQFRSARTQFQSRLLKWKIYSISQHFFSSMNSKPEQTDTETLNTFKHWNFQLFVCWIFLCFFFLNTRFYYFFQFCLLMFLCFHLIYSLKDDHDNHILSSKKLH